MHKSYTHVASVLALLARGVHNNMHAHTLTVCLVQHNYNTTAANYPFSYCFTAT